MPYIGQGLEQGRRQLYTFTATVIKSLLVHHIHRYVDVPSKWYFASIGDYTAQRN